MVYFLFILGFVVLILGADWLVKGASDIGRRLKLPEVVIGLTLVALGTSLPELIINIFASIGGETELAISNVLGSNIMNILVIVGVSALIFPLQIDRETTWRDIPFMFFSVMLLWFVANDHLFFSNSNMISRWDGALFLLFFVVFIVRSLKTNKEIDTQHPFNIPEKPATKSIVMILISLGMLYLGGRWIVNGTLAIADLLNLGQGEVGLVIVGFATSLPELVTSVMAAIRKQPGIAIGNAVGSCIFNIFFVLGISSLIRPLPFYAASNVDVMMMVGATLLLFLFIFTGRGRLLQRIEGLIMLVAYLVFVFFRVIV